MASLAPRVPSLIMAGERDAQSAEPVRAVRPIVERARLNRVEFFPTALHGYKLLRLEPRVTPAIARFLDANVKLRGGEWEPRYNLTPVPYGDIKLVRIRQAGQRSGRQGQGRRAREERAELMEFLSEDATYLAGGLATVGAIFLVLLRVTQQGKYLIWASAAFAWPSWRF